MQPSGKLKSSTIQSTSACPSQHVEFDRVELHQPRFHHAPVRTPVRPAYGTNYLQYLQVENHLAEDGLGRIRDAIPNLTAGKGEVQ